MRLYRFFLPLLDNKGGDYSAAIDEFRSLALDVAGGYTDIGLARGAWRDEKTGEVYHDSLALIDVALPNVAQFDVVKARALEIFPDQIALFTADIGESIATYRDALELKTSQIVA